MSQLSIPFGLEVLGALPKSNGVELFFFIGLMAQLIFLDFFSENGGCKGTFIKTVVFRTAEKPIYHTGFWF